MDGVRQYVLSVICVVIMCGITELFFSDGTIKALVRIITGLAVTVTVLNPLMQDHAFRWGFAVEEIFSDREAAIMDGQNMAAEAYCEIITDQTRAYILDEASSLGVDVTVEVELQRDYPNAPASVWIHGPVSPYVKAQLSAYLQQDLGIAEENQLWIS